MFKPNWLINVWMQANVAYVVFYAVSETAVISFDSINVNQK